MKVVNSSMPEPYKYETDYRKIPKQYLNNNIPQGRIMIKWQPFTTTLQQYEVDKPILDELALRDLNIMLSKIMIYQP